MELFTVIAFSVAFVCFFFATKRDAVGNPSPVKLLPLGLAVWVLVSLVVAVRALN